MCVCQEPHFPWSPPAHRTAGWVVVVAGGSRITPTPTQLRAGQVKEHSWVNITDSTACETKLVSLTSPSPITPLPPGPEPRTLRWARSDHAGSPAVLSFLPGEIGAACRGYWASSGAQQCPPYPRVAPTLPSLSSHHSAATPPSATGRPATAPGWWSRTPGWGPWSEAKLATITLLLRTCPVKILHAHGAVQYHNYKVIHLAGVRDLRQSSSQSLSSCAHALWKLMNHSWSCTAPQIRRNNLSVA